MGWGKGESAKEVVMISIGLGGGGQEEKELVDNCEGGR